MRRVGVGVFAASVVFAAVGVSNGSAAAPDTGSGAGVPPAEHPVGVITETLVDTSRPTPRSGDVAGLPERTLITTIMYPAAAAAPGVPVEGAPPDTAGGPYPLIVFSHGLGATPGYYEAILVKLAAAGNVVAAPRFPLTNDDAPAGPDAGDIVNQPGDVSFVIDEMLAAAGGDGPLAGLIRPKSIGVTGQSNGGITTLGVVAHSCCRDERIKAAAVLAGVPAPYPNGKYRFDNLPPLLVVHGTDDQPAPYDDMVRTFNKTRGPKAFLTIEGGDHGSSAARSPDSAPSVLRTIADFFDRYLDGETAALDRLRDDAEPGLTSIVIAAEPGSRKKIPIAAAPKLDRKATVTPHTGLEGGQDVTVRWSGFTPGGVVNIVQCGPDEFAGAGGCELTKGQILQPDPDGKGELALEIVEGPVGNAVCDAEHQGCVVVVNDDSSQLPDAILRIPIRFAR